MNANIAVGYDRDLAYIHHAGFEDYARGASPGLLGILRRAGIRDGLVVDLGCGSGIWARALTSAGYGVLGIDISRAMIALARETAPDARFRVGSLLSAELPACRAVTSIGECVNYLFDSRHGRAARVGFFRRVYQALSSGGVFVFDFAEPARAPDSPRRFWSEGPDWVALVETSGNRRRRRLTRRIVSFRRVGRTFRRREENHVLELYEASALISELVRVGFEVEQLARYGRFPLLPGMAALVGRKR